MLKFLKKNHSKDSEERERLKKELFGFTRCVDHGFPSQPRALAYDPKLKLLAIGTKTGILKIYGAPGVEFVGQQKKDVSINQLFFLPEQGRLITLCSDNSLHLWEINEKKEGNAVLEEVKEISMECNKLKTISTCSLTLNSDKLLIGTEGGNIHILEVQTFTLLEQIISQDVVMQSMPEVSSNPGAVEAIAVHPTNPDKFLIGFNRGYIVLWDNKTNNADRTYNASQQLESLDWHRNGTDFITAHADGSYLKWSTEESSSPKESSTTPYGPFPCKAISKIQWKSSKSGPFYIFSGGMPRASYGDKHTVTVMQEENHVVFDFTSKVIDFITVSTADEEDKEDGRQEYDEPHALVVLVQEEIVVIDLDSPNWPAFKLPYLNSLHSSAITCSYHVNNVPEQLWQKIIDAGETQVGKFSHRTWPIDGGKTLASETLTRDLLLTGHEDGTIRFWDASTTSLTFLYKLSTANIFSGETSPPDNSAGEAEEEWPPFKKVGSFDPYSDDPRWAIQKIALCPLSETLIAAGTAGQVIVLQMEREQREQEVTHVTINIVGDSDNFVWKGHEALAPQEGDLKFAPGFQPTCVMQLLPPAACTSLAINSEWQLGAAGTAHGFALFDYCQKKGVLYRCTLNPNDMTNAVVNDSLLSRRISFKKSLRESFRRLRKSRANRREKMKKEKCEIEGGEAVSTEGTAPAEGASASASPLSSSPELKPMERQVEARSLDDSMASIVRFLYFADTFAINNTSHQPTLWVGTNAGYVYIYTITIPPSDKRASESVSSFLAKEIKLRHRAPVISMAVIDKRARVLPEPLEVLHERAKAADMSGEHQLVVCSEEQFKVFSLPNLKPVCKRKLTVIDGSMVRKVSFVNFRSRSDENYSEFDIACLTNLGELRIYTLPSLRLQLAENSIKKEDLNGISSFIFTKNGQGFHLICSSEFCRTSLSKRYVTQPNCTIELAEGMRPEPVAEPEALPETEQQPAEPSEQVNAPSTENPANELEGEAEGPEGTGTNNDVAENIEGLIEETQHNDSRADTTTTTTGDISQDSIIDVASEAGTLSPTASPITTETVNVNATTITTTTITTTTTTEGTPLNITGDSDCPENSKAAVEINTIVTETEDKFNDLKIKGVTTVTVLEQVAQAVEG
ncbi:(2) giant larvae homolog 1-like isoform X1 [Octopus vulgaris]|uniref:(2) giant larvae homolog 1-like isoform X1 n=1 Tax=Octopus vulgaris TaxID=6645 RepID=A0AA36AZ07_OCTVU|nr:(2) giant larvae homolog 1-like isoform X1 [Octopus vulgaris]